MMRGVDFRSEVALPIHYKGLTVDCSYRLDFVVDDAVIVEVKSVDTLDGIHTAQVLTYLRLLKLELGLLINFNVPTLWRGVRRVANSLPAISAAADSPRSHGGHGGP
jgi:GxxExxY protein